MVHLHQEHFRVFALDVRLRLIKAKTIAIGSLSACPVEPREVFRFAIEEGAHCVVAVHNHPSGEPSPSSEDLDLTLRLKAVGLLVGIRLVDHVVVAKSGHYSFEANGAL
jgi:DNA repair protein RadC